MGVGASVEPERDVSRIVGDGVGLLILRVGVGDWERRDVGSSVKFLRVGVTPLVGVKLCRVGVTVIGADGVGVGRDVGVTRRVAVDLVVGVCREVGVIRVV